MSKAQASRTIKLVQHLGTLTAALVCSKGELWQQYVGDASTATDIAPDFTADPPVVDLYVTSSNVSTGETLPGAIEVWFGGDKVGSVVKTTNNGTDSYSVTYETPYATGGAYAGLFEILVPGAGGRTRYGVKIRKNLVPVTLGAGSTLTVKAVIEAGTSSDTVAVSIPYRCQRSTGSGMVVAIESGDGFNCTLSRNDASYTSGVKLSAKAYDGASAVAPGTLTYEWYRQDETVTAANTTTGDIVGWQRLQGKTGPDLVVDHTMVDASEQFRVMVYRGGNFVGSAIRTVYDASDPYEIKVTANPADETIEQGVNTEVRYKVQLVDRVNGTPTTEPVSWTFMVLDSAGVQLINPATNSTGDFIVTEAMCVQAGNVSLVITAN